MVNEFNDSEKQYIQFFKEEVSKIRFSFLDVVLIIAAIAGLYYCSYATLHGL